MTFESYHQKRPPEEIHKSAEEVFDDGSHFS